MKKFVIAFFLSTSMVVICFFSGGTIASQLFIEENDGLASAATAALFGFLGATLGLIVSIVLMFKLKERSKMILAIILFLISLIIWGVFHRQYSQRQKEMRYKIVDNRNRN